MLDDKFLIKKECIFQRISKVLFSLIGTFLEIGKLAHTSIIF